eukprot:3849579-Rhodomonas_salina.2
MVRRTARGSTSGLRSWWSRPKSSSPSARKTLISAKAISFQWSLPFSARKLFAATQHAPSRAVQSRCVYVRSAGNTTKTGSKVVFDLAGGGVKMGSRFFLFLFVTAKGVGAHRLGRRVQLSSWTRASFLKSHSLT